MGSGILYRKLTHEDVHRAVAQFLKRGGVIEQLPEDVTVIYIEGNPYNYAAGFYYEPFYHEDGSVYYSELHAPEGAIIFDLPPGYVQVNVPGGTFFRVGNTYYRQVFYGTQLAYECVRRP